VEDYYYEAVFNIKCTKQFEPGYRIRAEMSSFNEHTIEQW